MVRSDQYKLIKHHKPDRDHFTESPVKFIARHLLTPDEVLMDREEEPTNRIHELGSVAETLRSQVNRDRGSAGQRSDLGESKREELENLGYL